MYRDKTLSRIVVFFGLVTFFTSEVSSSTLSYPAGGLPQAYGSGTPCSSPFTGIINVPDSLTISDIDIRFRASHPWRTDTNLSITSPDGTIVDLLTGNYAANRDNYNVTFDDDAGVVVDTGAHDVNQSATGPGMDVRSEGDPLSNFDGEDAQGNWSFSICDVYPAADNGSLLELSLMFDVLPNIVANKTVETYEVGSFSVPGSDVVYTFDVTNEGLGTADDGSIIIIDSLPSDLEFYNGDMDDAGPLTTTPMAFSETGSGLTFTYGSDAKYSNLGPRPADMTGCNYTPAPGYDSAVRHICINPKGEFLAGDPDPNFKISFRARIK